MRENTPVQVVRILFIESQTSDASRVQSMLAGMPDKNRPYRLSFDLTRARTLEGGREQLIGDRSFDLVLFDVGVPDATTFTSIQRLQTASDQLPMVVLADGEHPDMAIASIRQGVQDWLAKSELTGLVLTRTISHAMARKDFNIELRRQLQRLRVIQANTRHQMDELCARAEKIDAINRELDDFVYVVSHDLKEPLRGIRAYCELLAEDYESQIDASGLDRLRSIMRMCLRLETQIADLLTFYRVGRVRTSAVRVDLTEVVDGQVAALRNMLDQRNGTVRVRGPLPTVEGHPVLLGMVFGNLISNGVKYNRAERPIVEIGTTAGRPCKVYVRDNGIGIAREHHDAIFDLFRRLHGHGEFEGSGAGLTIVRKIVRSYGGEISVESEIGRGSTFLVALPTATLETPKKPHWMSHSEGKMRGAMASRLSCDRS